jgi:hypothetical protein
MKPTKLVNILVLGAYSDHAGYLTGYLFDFYVQSEKSFAILLCDANLLVECKDFHGHQL